WEQQKANNWPIELVAPKLNELKAHRERVMGSLAEVRQKRSTVLVDMEKSASVSAALESIRAKLDAGLTQNEKLNLVRLMVPGGVVRTVGSGQNKRAEVSLDIKWVAVLAMNEADAYPQVPEDWKSGSVTVRCSRRAGRLAPTNGSHAENATGRPRHVAR